ncbi:hypothetical protein KAFR_0B07040 [Kazachstania africana CBS 2517]|uniref:Uncharacterized protein n=1 Tax=Kazachstania africana (strain ATCC 22294 / BCRC 22015 / CBS 2517 / CECT 1963 / NBRC 1671 / NRRL Y-8276) TaxID=1071382 RepID=H2ARK3_KAZAF|nr:hypothetical protein KAFR_0B07040 [Kazachstania africana CBS 2517]CCF57003.1 hypothetical protein KAFR_0B07040 [Kazachstania africana CBS 2517]
MKLTVQKATTGLGALASTISASSLSPEDIAQLELAVSEYKANAASYMMWGLTADYPMPDGLANIFLTAVHYTDDFYTTLFSNIAMSDMQAIAEALPWNTVYYSSEIASVRAAAASSAQASSVAVNGTSSIATSSAVGINATSSGFEVNGVSTIFVTITDINYNTTTVCDYRSTSSEDAVSTIFISKAEGAATKYETQETTVTVCDEVCESRKSAAAAATAKTSKVAAPTTVAQVTASSASQTVQEQSINGAIKNAVGMGVAVLGAVVLLL